MIVDTQCHSLYLRRCQGGSSFTPLRFHRWLTNQSYSNLRHLRQPMFPKERDALADYLFDPFQMAGLVNATALPFV